MSHRAAITTPVEKSPTQRKRIPSPKGRKRTVAGSASGKSDDVFGLFDRDPDALGKKLSMAFHEAKRKAISANQFRGPASTS
jgi:hypothetical protein